VKNCASFRFVLRQAHWRFRLLHDTLIEAFFNNFVLNDNSRSFVQSKVKVAKA
jgi:hypothetical protein